MDDIKVLIEKSVKDGNRIIRTRVESLPLYRVKRVADECCNFIDYSDYLENCHFCLPIWSDLHDSKLNSHNMNEFKKSVRLYYGDDFNFYYVQLYKHSTERFVLTNTNEKVDKWDSSVVGVCAIPKHTPAEYISSVMTDIWEGTIVQYIIIDNETDEIVASYERWFETNTIKDWYIMCSEAKEKYGVELDEVK